MAAKKATTPNGIAGQVREQLEQAGHSAHVVKLGTSVAVVLVAGCDVIGRIVQDDDEGSVVLKGILEEIHRTVDGRRRRHPPITLGQRTGEVVKPNRPPRRQPR